MFATATVSFETATQDCTVFIMENFQGFRVALMEMTQFINKTETQKNVGRLGFLT